MEGIVIDTLAYDMIIMRLMQSNFSWKIPGVLCIWGTAMVQQITGWMCGRIGFDNMTHGILVG